MPRLKRKKAGEGVDFISCRLCRRPFKAITYFHLSRKHHLDSEHPIEEYKSRFGLRVAISLDSKLLRRAITVKRVIQDGHRLSRSEVLDRLRAERSAGRSMYATAMIRRSSTVHRSAIRIFGSWLAAVRAAGIDPELARGSWKWTSERIQQVLQSRVRRGLSIQSHHMARECPGLLDSASLRYGTWRAAVRAAGCEGALPPQQRHWTRKELIRLLRAIRKERGTVTYKALGKMNQPGFLSPLVSVERHFGTLSRARVAAGLPAYEWRPRKWSRIGVIDAIRARVKRGQSVRTGAIQEEAGGLMVAAHRYFGTWSKAAQAAGAGRLLGAPFRRWTKESILDRIRRASREGRSLAGRDFRKADPGFYNTACRHLGGWARAVQAAGLGAQLPSPPRHWTREELIALLRGYWRRTGRLSSEVIKAHKRPGCMGPAYSITKVFGSFPAAKRAAGLEHVPSYPVRKWTPRAVIANLRARAHRGLPMNYTALERDCYPLLRALYARFGSVANAFKTARLRQPPVRERRGRASHA